MTGADKYILEMQIRDAKNVIDRYSKYNKSTSIHVVEEATRRLKELEQELQVLEENES